MKAHSAAPPRSLVSADAVGRVEEILASERLTEKTADMFKLLSDPTRLKIVLALQEVELCVGDAALLGGLSPSVVSHHLKTLRQANLVSYRRQGKKTFYRLADSHVSALLAVARDHARESL